MFLGFILLILSFSFSISSAPTNCKTCKGHFLIFNELESKEEKIKNIEDFYSKVGTPYEKWAYTFPFEFGMINLIKEKGINYAYEEFNQCGKNRILIRELCSKLSGFQCKDI